HFSNVSAFVVNALSGGGAQEQQGMRTLFLLAGAFLPGVRRGDRRNPSPPTGVRSGRSCRRDSWLPDATLPRGDATAGRCLLRAASVPPAHVPLPMAGSRTALAACVALHAPDTVPG